MAIKKTIDEWCKELNIVILDPDGFDRTDEHLYERLFTKEKFQKAIPLCNVMMIAKF